MGATGAFGMAEAVTDGQVSLRAAIHWHLRSNHFPPVPLPMVPVAVAAVEAVNEDEPERLISLPAGVAHRDGRTAVEAYTIVDSLRLEAFAMNVDYDDEFEGGE